MIKKLVKKYFAEELEENKNKIDDNLSRNEKNINEMIQSQVQIYLKKHIDDILDSVVKYKIEQETNDILYNALTKPLRPLYHKEIITNYNAHYGRIKLGHGIGDIHQQVMEELANKYDKENDSTLRNIQAFVKKNVQDEMKHELIEVLCKKVNSKSFMKDLVKELNKFQLNK